MVTAQYNGNTGAAKIYLNNTLFASGTLAANLNMNQSNFYQISNDTTGFAGTISGFNGLITNLQVYDSYLTPQEVGTLYNSGLTSAPLDNSGLLGWWPLLNNAVDYSLNNDNGTLTGCSALTYPNSAYNNTAPIGPGFATFNGLSSAVIPYTPTLSTVNSVFTVSFWFSDFSGSTSNLDQSLISVETGSGLSANALDISLCGANSCGLTGLHGDVGTGITTLSSSINYQFNFNRNTWYAATEVFTTTGWTLYLNGNKAASGTYSGTPQLLLSGDSIHLGNGPGLGSFTGQMANLQIYNSALSPQQVMQLYVQGLPTQYRNNISIG